MMDGQEPEKRENPYKKQPKVEEATVGQTETFVTRNVKLITFLVCVAVFLVFLGPLSIWHFARSCVYSSVCRQTGIQRWNIFE